MKHLLFWFLILFFGTNLSAQKLSVPASSLVLDEIAPTADYLYQDAEEKVLFIDFSKLIDGIQALEIFDNHGESILVKDLKSVRNDEIIEIDYQSFKQGSYKLNLLKEDETIQTAFNINF
jgi:hypothetical protein